MPANVFVGNIARSSQPADVERLFAKYGHIVNCKIKDGYGFVEFEYERDADDAIRALDGYDFDGSRLRVEFGRGKRDGGGPPARGGPGPTGNNRIYVEGLDSYTSWQDLKDFARRAGHPVFTDVFHDRGGKVGVVEYKNRDDVNEALRSLDGATLHDRRVRVVEERGGGGRGGGGGGGGRSRSPRRRSRSPPYREPSPRRGGSRDRYGGGGRGGDSYGGGGRY